MEKINFFNTHISEHALERVKEVLQTTFLSEGKLVADFEMALTRQCGIINPVALNSGTAALHLALVTAGIGKGDEVILPAQTFIASGLAVLMTGARPVFADIQYLTGNIDPGDIAKKITTATKAIMPVHWGGYPCDMDEITAIAVANNLLVIEDAAHAIGATYKGNAIGSISDLTCFSFQAIKHVTTGDGGALACRDPKHLERAMALRWFGIDRNNSPVGFLGERVYNLTELGYKYHLNNYGAALGLANITDLQQNLDRRRAIAGYYDQELKSVKGISLFKYEENRESSYWLYGFHVQNRDAFVKALQEKGIPASIVHAGIDVNDVFSHSRIALPVQRQFDATQVHLPVHNAITDEQVSHIVKSIRKGW